MYEREIIHNSVPLPIYIKRKLKMLREDFKLSLSESEIEHMDALTTEIAVDNYAQKLILSHL